LTPIQAVVLNISEKQAEYAQKIVQILQKDGVRANLDLRNEKIGFKIREHTLQKVPYLLIVGDNEVTTGQIAIRTRDGKDLGKVGINEIANFLCSQQLNIKVGG